MLGYHTQTTATIGRSIIFPPPFDEVEKPDMLRFFWQNMRVPPEVNSTPGTIVENISYPFGGWKNPEISEPPTQNTSTSLELSFEEKVASGMAQEFAETEQQMPAFPFYNEDDILNLDAVIATPPPRQSGTIRVKLIYEEPSKPIPVQNPWEE